MLTKFSKDMKESLEDVINQILMLRGTQAYFNEFGVALNYTLIDKGLKITDKFASVIMDGTVHSLK